MIDSHSHIYLEEFDEDRNDVVRRAKEAGLSHIVLPNVDLETVERMISTHEQFPEYTSMAMGLHPTSVNENYKQDLQETYTYFANHQFVAVGEVGIDLYWDKTFRNEQMEVFDTQLHWAKDMDIPVIIHCRDGLYEVLEVFHNFSDELPMCVFHSFGGSIADVERIRTYGDFYFGVNGIVTFKNSDLSTVLPTIGMERILLETDCPYLAPVPKRGKRNESSYVPFIAQKIADTFGITVTEVSDITDANAKRFFKF